MLINVGKICSGRIDEYMGRHENLTCTYDDKKYMIYLFQEWEEFKYLNCIQFLLIIIIYNVSRNTKNQLKNNIQHL